MLVNQEEKFLSEKLRLRNCAKNLENNLTEFKPTCVIYNTIDSKDSVYKTD